VDEGRPSVRLGSWVEHDPARWDAFVERAPYRSFSQMWAWGDLRGETGWTALRMAVGDRDELEGPILAGVQLMVRRIPLLGVALAYAPRGPVGMLDDDAIWSELMVGMRRLATDERIATLRLEPEALVGSKVAERMRARFWRRARAVQPVTTRLVDLSRAEDELRGGLRKKHRQYISRAEREGLSVECFDARSPDADVAAALADFHRILDATGDRAGFNVRVPGYYREVWAALASGNRARLFFATREGERLATLFHIACGDHIAELYGGATPEGTRLHANYLVKWQAMLRLKSEGFTRYDLWGQPTGGIAQFKEGFGGEQVQLVGARDLVVDRAGDLVVRTAIAARSRLTRMRSRRGRRQDGTPAGFREATAADATAWQGLVERSPAADVLHDWEWAPVAAFDGTPQRRFVVEEGGHVVAMCAAQVRRTSLGRSFWYVPRGPVLDYDDPRGAERLAAILAGLKAAARRERAIAVRIEPRVERDTPAATLFDHADLRRIRATLQTPDTRLVDLTLDDEALLATFDKDTRYAIRRAEREGVTTSVIADPANDEAVVELHAIVTETLDRAGYHLPSLERYRLIWRGLAGANRARIIQARHEGRLESAGLLVIEGDRSIYLYAGSIREAKGETKRFASYAVQWQMLRTARELGSRTHDLWGVAPQDAGPDHPWYGYSLFKKGFSGRFVSWAGSWDLVVDPLLYALRELASRARGRYA
jgi:peptidoglycan pentaglycine glycine transferase (the first glycine)